MDLSNILKSLAPMMAIFIVPSSVAAFILPDDLVIVIIIGLSLAFLVLLFTLSVMFVIAKHKLVMKTRSLIEASAVLLAEIGISDALIALVPEEQRLLIMLFSLSIAFLSYLIIIGFGVAIAFIDIHEIDTSDKIATFAPKVRENRWLKTRS